MSGPQRWTLTVVCVSTAVLLINVAAPNVALEAIARDLDASFTDLQWVLSGYSLVLAVFQLTAGSLADLFGRRRLFVIGVCLFTAASALCALAPSANLLIAARALQGLGAAIMFPSSLALLAQEFEGPARSRAIGVWGAVIGLAFAAGPLVGGLLVDGFGWQAIFALGVVLGLPTIALALTKIGESRDPDPSPVDWPGVASLSLGLFLIVFAVLRGNALGWTSAPVVGLVLVGGASLAMFVRVEMRAADPMLDLRLFRNRTFLGATVIVATLAAGSFGCFVYLSLFLLDVGGGSPVEVGLWLAPLALVAFAVALLMILNQSGSDQSGEQPASSSSPAATATPAASKPKRKRKVYVVKPGDTPSGIADKTGVSLEELEKANPDLDPQLLAPGQRIKLPQ